MRNQKIHAVEQDVEITLDGNAALAAAGGLPWAKLRIKELRGVRPIDIITDLRLTLLQNGSEPVPLLGKACLLVGWSEIEITEAIVQRWGVEHPEWSNTGLRTARIPSLDSDVDDPRVAKSIRTFMTGWCHNGRMLIRTGRAPRFAVPFRCDVPFSKIKRELKDDAKIELLATGQLIVVDGVHPYTGRPYTWDANVASWNVRRDALPPLDAGLATVLLDELVAKIERDHPGFITKRQRTRGDDADTSDQRSNVIDCRTRIKEWREAKIYRGHSLELSDYNATSVAEIRAACNALNQQLEHDDRVKIGFALLDELGDNDLSYELFEQNAQTRNSRKIKNTWKRLAKSRPRENGVTIRSLFDLAYQINPDWHDNVDRGAPPHPMEAPKAESEVVIADDYEVPESEPAWEPEPAIEDEAPKVEDEAPASEAKQAPADDKSKQTNDPRFHWHGEETTAQINWAIKGLLKETGVATIVAQGE
jgi:hypothetical protein